MIHTVSTLPPLFTMCPRDSPNPLYKLIPCFSQLHNVFNFQLLLNLNQPWDKSLPTSSLLSLQMNASQNPVNQSYQQRHCGQPYWDVCGTTWADLSSEQRIRNHCFPQGALYTCQQTFQYLAKGLYSCSEHFNYSEDKNKALPKGLPRISPSPSSQLYPLEVHQWCTLTHLSSIFFELYVFYLSIHNVFLIFLLQRQYILIVHRLIL